MHGLIRRRWLYSGLVMPVVLSLLLTPVFRPLSYALAASPSQIAPSIPSPATNRAPPPAHSFFSLPDDIPLSSALTSTEPQPLSSASLSGLKALWETLTSDPQPAQGTGTEAALAPIETKFVVLQPAKEALLESADKKLKIAFPAGTVAEDVRVEVKVHRPWGSTGTRMLNLFEVNGFAVNRQDAKVTSLLKQAQITIANTETELAGLDSSSLALYYLDETTRTWQPVSGKFDPATRTLTAQTDHFSYYGEQANPAISGPGQVLAFQVDLHSGAAVSRYPIELPPGPGGFQPKLELAYNSASADEMKNKRSLGS